MKNHYQLFGIDNFATFEEIAEAYKKQYAELFSSESPLSNIPKLKELKDAFDLLSDDDLKAEYDEELAIFLEKINEKFDNAVKELSNSNFTRCIEIITECIKENPGETDYYETMGIAHRLSGDVDSAIKCFQQGLKLDKRKAFFHRYLGEAYQMKHDEEKADEHFIEAADQFKSILKTDPKNVSAMEQLAEIYSKMQWFEESFDVYEQLIKRFPYKGEYRREVGVVLYELNLFEEAERQLLEALRITPGDAPSLLFLGLVYFKRRLLTMAVQTLNDSIKANPNQPEVKQLISQIENIRTEIGKTVEEIIYDPCPDAIVEGRVKWYNPETGLGSLECSDFPDVLLHYSAIKQEDLETIKKGDSVRFGVVKDKLSPVAVQIELLEAHTESETLPGKIDKFDSDKKIGVIKSFDGKEIIFSYSVLTDEVINSLETGLDVLFESKSSIGLSDKPVEQATRVRLRKKKSR